jgi:hypothetical protein
MYYVKTRSEGTIILNDTIGSRVQKDWLNKELPNPFEIVPDLIIKSSDILSIKKVSEQGSSDQPIYEMSKADLQEEGKLFYQTYLKAKEIPHYGSYDQNEVYPYHNLDVIHTFAVGGGISWNPEHKTWMVHADIVDGKVNINNFLALDRSYQALAEYKYRDGETRYYDKSKLMDLFQI